MSKTITKTHIKNIIKIHLGELKRKQARRRRRRQTNKSTNQSNNLLQAIQSLRPVVHNVSNPIGYNSSTLLSKIDELKTEQKLGELQKQLNRINEQQVVMIELLVKGYLID